MLKFNMDIQLFGNGGTWTQGITVDGIRAAYNEFKNKCDEAIAAVKAYESVDAALKEGWSGVDCEAYLEKFHTHAEHVVADIETYKNAVGVSVEKIINQWDTFQQNLIS